MTNDQVRKKLAKLRERLTNIQHWREETLLAIKQTQERCKHSSRKRWTNNDGDGRFIVERCNICGLQRDDGLGSSSPDEVEITPGP